MEYVSRTVMNSDTLLSLKNIPITELLNSIPHGVAVIDTNFRLLEMNHTLEANTGHRNTEARGGLIDSIIKSSLGGNYDVFHEASESGEAISFTGDIINKNNRKIPIQFTLTPLKDEEGRLSGFNIILEDISFLRSADRTVSEINSSFEIIGHSPKMQEIFELMPILAKTDATILITGQTGTGKDLIAESIHKNSKRSRHPFIKINCGALPEALLESELFGHVKGAFTGAVNDKPGLFRLAQEGTIFLTEIGDLPMPLQVKLLSVLDDKEFFPVGGSRKMKVDVRVIAATHRSLRKLVREGRFREDLFYRLNVLRLYLPALSERDGDIRLLLDHFLREFNDGLSKNIKGFSRACIDILLSYDYPGNVRELRNIVEYAVNICQAKQIKSEHLPQYIFDTLHENTLSVADIEDDSRIQNSRQDKDAAHQLENKGWSDVEKEMILDVLRKTRGNRTEAAHQLGWGRTTLWRKMNRYGLG